MKTAPPAVKATAVKAVTKAAVTTTRKDAGAVAKKPAGTVVATRAKRGRAEERHPHPPVAYRLHALLHTIHSIEHHEDELCTLLTEIEREGTVGPEVGRELLALLEGLPLRAFVADLEAARRALETVTAGEAKAQKAVGAAAKRKRA